MLTVSAEKTLVSGKAMVLMLYPKTPRLLSHSDKGTGNQASNLRSGDVWEGKTRR